MFLQIPLIIHLQTEVTSAHNIPSSITFFQQIASEHTDSYEHKCSVDYTEL
jgi:hypothetical protein